MYRNKILDDIWIDLSFFKDITTSSSVNLARTNLLQDAYIIWEEANKTILESSGNKEKLNQGFLSLKRAFNVASIELKKNTGIDEIQYSGKNKRNFFSVLEYFDIVKTLSLKSYLDIRNLIEHQNAEPPSIEKSLLLSEYIWNYIRNVSNVLNNFIDNFYFQSDEGKADFSYSVIKKKEKFIPKLNVTMCINKKNISFIEIPNSLKVNKFQIITKSRQKGVDGIISADLDYYRNSLQHVVFIGEIDNPDIIVKYIKYMVLPEHEGINEKTIYEIFK